MIRKYVADIAETMGVPLTRAHLIDGGTVGCRDVHLLRLTVENNMDTILVFKSELDQLDNGALERKIRKSLQSLAVENCN